MRVLVTGCAGFIGFHICKRLIHDDIEVVGVDNLNDYYDVELKKKRLELLKSDKFTLYKTNVSSMISMDMVFKRHQFDSVIHLAAQAGVDYSLENPAAYIDSNIVGFFNVIECCRNYNVKKLLFASSSSVYGNYDGLMKTDCDTDKPISLYAATKKCDELIAYTYSQLYGIRTCALRFFSVYGEYGRPDMAYWRFTENIMRNEPITLNNNGNIYRDFTYIDDVVEGVYRILAFIPKTDKKELFMVYNIGAGSPINIKTFAEELHKQMVKSKLIDKDNELKFDYAPMKQGDALMTCADTSELWKDYRYKPNTLIYNGLKFFVDWYKLYIIKKV